MRGGPEGLRLGPGPGGVQAPVGPVPPYRRGQDVPGFVGAVGHHVQGVLPPPPAGPHVQAAGAGGRATQVAERAAVTPWLP